MNFKIQNEILDKLNDYSAHTKKMQTDNFSRKSVKKFKTYYDAMHLELIEYVKLKKDKHLSEKVKKLNISKDIFRSMDMWIAFLSIGIVFPGILLIYLYQSNTDLISKGILTIISAIGVFLLIKKVNNQSAILLGILKNNEKQLLEVAAYIKKLKEV